MIFWQGHLCPGLHATTNLTILRRFATKNRGRSAFSRFTIFRYFLVFFTYHRGFPNSTNSAKIVKNRGRNDFLHFTIFCYFLVFHLPDGASEFNKFCGNCEISRSQRFVAHYDFSLLTSLLSSLTREGFRIQLIPRKVQKIVLLPHFTIFPYVFIT